MFLILNSRKKPIFWKLIAVLRNDENLIYIEIDNLKKGNLLKVYLVHIIKFMMRKSKKLMIQMI